MVNYSEGKIYKIVCNITGDIYIGSTCEKYLKTRLAKHIAKYKYYKKGNGTLTTSFKILEKNNYDIILIENYKCNSKDELHARERYFIENTNCINKYIPGRKNKEYGKIYYEKNKEEIKKYQATRTEYRKEYYIKNKEKMNKYRMDKYDNKENIKRKDYFKKRNDYLNSWGGNKNYNNNLLEIDINLFI